MYLRFKKVHIEGFQSIGNCDINLDNQGIVFIKGINNYDSLTDSNGSGKSSIFESIYWSLFGKTTKGVSKVKNRYTNEGCLVELNFNIDSDEYLIRRSINHNNYGTGLLLYLNGENISARNKTDTDKLIQSDILKEFSQDIFLSIVFLSQGFNNRLSELSPSGRKDRLESLSQISIRISKFKDKLMELLSRYDNEYNKINCDISNNSGKLSVLKSELDRLENIIKESTDNRPDVDINKIEADYENLQNKSKEIQLTIDRLSKSLNENKYKIASNSSDIKIIINDININKTNLTNTISNVCPTCKRIMEIPNKADLIKQYKDKILKFKHRLSDLNNENDKLEEEIKKIEDKIQLLIDNRCKINSEAYNLYITIQDFHKFRDVSSDVKRCNDIREEIIDIEKFISENKILLGNTNYYKGAVNHCISIVSKQFRNYLLSDVIDFMNSRLLEYSKLLYSNEDDVIKLVSDSSKLDIYLGDAIYDTLSGGEGRKVDLALALAQRDLALRISGSSSNILILDEIMDNLDDKAINSVASMFVSVADDVDSMFVISHKQPDDIPYDSIITVVKNNDKISDILRS